VTFGADVLDALKPERSLARRNLPGGTGPEALQNQLRAAAEALTR
jgi:argininosuccinate lyase